MVLDWYAITLGGLEDLWVGFIDFLPRLAGALVVFVIGWFVAMAVGMVVADVLRKVKFNQIFEREVWKEALAKADLKVDVSGFIGNIFKWVLLIVFVLAAVEILGFDQLAGFVRDVLAYLPNVLIASLIFVVAVMVTDIIEKVLRALVETTHAGYGHTVGAIVRWSIWIFTAIIILEQLGVAQDFMQALYGGIINLIVLAGGIALGLGGKDVAAEFLNDVKSKLMRK